MPDSEFNQADGETVLLTLREPVVRACAPRFDPAEHGECWCEPLLGPLQNAAALCKVECRITRADGTTYFGPIVLVDAPRWLVNGERLRVTLLPYLLTERLIGRLALVRDAIKPRGGASEPVAWTRFPFV